jgi:hypothetical protein
MKIRNQFNLIKILILCATCAVVSGYGYTGNLPELGKHSQEETQDSQAQETQSKPNLMTIPDLKPAGIVVPRLNAGYNASKYKSYLQDVEELHQILKELKEILEQGKQKDKVQLFCAKVHYMNLYMDIFREKYINKPERFYETYKQLVMLEKYLSEISEYKRSTDRYRETLRGSLKDKIDDEGFLRRKVDMALIPINTVLEIIEDAG